MLTVNFSAMELTAGDRLLDIGCGEGRHVIHACLHHDILGIGVDLSQRDLTTAKDRFEPYNQFNPRSQFFLQQTDATQLPFADASFDKIICSEVLEHIDDYQQVLREIHRVLKPNGTLSISVPRAWPEKICWRLSAAYHQVEGGHIRIFDRRELKDAVTRLGFRCFKTHWAHALHTPYWWLTCWLWNTQETSTLIKRYHQLLVWDLMKKPWITQFAEKCLNPLLGKSVVMYFKKIEHNVA